MNNLAYDIINAYFFIVLFSIVLSIILLRKEKFTSSIITSLLPVICLVFIRNFIQLVCSVALVFAVLLTFVIYNFLNIKKSLYIQNKMNLEYDLREKTFITFLVFTILMSFHSFLYSLYRVTANKGYTILYFLIYSLALILLLQKTDRLKKFGWVLVLISACIVLFNPLPSPSNQDLSIGTFITLIQSSSAGDLTTALLMLVSSLFQILIITYSISELINYKNQKFDFVTSLIFTITFCFSFLGFPIITGSFILYDIVKSIFISILYIGLVILWYKSEENYKSAIL